MIEIVSKNTDKKEILSIYTPNLLKKEIPFPKKSKTDFSFIDLFAGVGGFRLALQELGGECFFSSEINPDSAKTYELNFGEKPFGDITTDITKNFIPKKFDILCAGFPCQPFSIAGYQKGFTDTRGTLFFEIEKIIEKHKPKVVFLENVKNLASHDKGRTLKIIIDCLEKKLNYQVFFKVLNSATHADIPQNRERIFIVCFDNTKFKNKVNFKFPAETPLKNNIENFIFQKKQDQIYYYSSSHQYYKILNESINSMNTIYQWRRVYLRENKKNLCPTLTANMGTGGHNVPIIRDKFGIRKLTPKECFAFQGFPINEFLFPQISNSKLYFQAGNSVTMPLIKKIGIEILKVL